MGSWIRLFLFYPARFPCFSPPVIYYKRYYDNAFSPILAVASDFGRAIVA